MRKKMFHGFGNLVTLLLEKCWRSYGNVLRVVYTKDEIQS